MSKELEDHVNEKDIELEKISTELQETKEEVKRLNERTENAEMNSRILCLVLSGRALAPKRGPRLAAPLPPTADGSAPQGSGSAGPAGSSGSRTDGSGASGGRAGGGGGGRGGSGDVADINRLVIGAVRSRFQGLEITDSDMTERTAFRDPTIVW